MKKRRIIIASLIFLLLIVGYRVAVKKNGSTEDMIEVGRGDLIKEIFEVGAIKRGEEINLSFGVSGVISKIFLKEGDQVKKGDLIASLDNDKLKIDLKRAENALTAAKIEYDQLMNPGGKLQEAKINLNNAQSNFDLSFEGFETTKDLTDKRLDNLYKESISSIDKVILSTDLTYDTVSEIVSNCFSQFYTSDARKALNARDEIKSSLDKVKEKRSLIDEQNKELIKETLLETEASLNLTYSNLDLIKEILEDRVRYQSAQNEIAEILTQKSSTNLSLSSIVSLIGSIETLTTSKDSEVLAAKRNLKTAEGALDLAFEQLSSIESLVDLAQIRVDQSTFDLNLAQEMLKESEIRAPYDGTLFRVNSEPNEFVMTGTAIVSFLLDQSYYAEVFIYEGDIIDVSIGNPVEIEIVAFPKEVFFGEVAFIDQAPKIIDGIVNYKVLISIENLPEEVMFGMTSDVTIITKKKESVIFIPESYIKDNSVLLVSDDGFVKTSVEIGMKSTDRNVEILSGLREGDRLVTLK